MMQISKILERALAGKELTEAEGVALLRSQSQDEIAEIRVVADALRQQQVGETVTYVVNRNINFTNICEQHCSFCAFRRDKDEEGAYWLELDQILEKTAEAVRVGATEICMQGGLNPEAKRNGRSLDFYVQLILAIREKFPELHLHTFSPQEVQFIAREDGLTYAYVIAALRDAGVGSLPGTAAEVLDDSVRRVICPEKINSATWLEIIETAHEQGLSTTSTMLSGHIETPEQQIHHLSQLRSLQKRSLAAGSGAITEFILLPFVQASTESGWARSASLSGLFVTDCGCPNFSRKLDCKSPTQLGQTWIGWRNRSADLGL